MGKLVLFIALVMLVVILARSPAAVVSDTRVSPVDGNILDNEMTTNQTEARQFFGKCYNNN